MIHLYSHGFTDEDMLDFALTLNNPSSVAQLQKLELIKTKFEIAGAAPEGSVDRSWIRKNILGLSDEDIEKIKVGRKSDKIEDAEVESAKPGGGEEGGAEAGGAEPEAGGDAGGEGGGGEEGGAEDLFAGDFKTGPLLGEIDGELPVRPKSEAQNVFGGRIRKKKSRFSNSKAEVPDFLAMTLDSRPQSTSNEPFGHSMTRGMKNEDDISTSLLDALLGERNFPKPRKTSEIASALRSFDGSIVRRRGAVLSESDIGSKIAESEDLKDDEA